MNVTRSGIGSEEERVQLTAIALLLYEELRSAPAFRYAIAGVEAEAFRTIHELDQRDLESIDGLVVSEGVWKKLNGPDTMEQFSPGYRWHPLVSAR
ncbi:hypothetical protein [Luteolibacter luteus]|uniref:Uncharacterized protein n=1 Tax=Luteolibacter luteus TaxID=2728835 RepID=A0A858RMP5_9BACT|nr:hypothetical protein [Luteolibacter luteus]QJE97851.1 hypothetical protein HHL09_19365 [Luteolibacter luteus]